MKKRKILKGAVVLLLAVAMVLTTASVTADTINEESVYLTSTPTKYIQPKTENMGRAVLWDQYDTDGSNGLSHAHKDAFGQQRALLDDFEVPDGATWNLNDLHSLNLWNTMQPGQGTDFHLEFWTDAGGQPGNPIVTAATVSYTETATGRTWFERPEFEIEYVYETITLTEGVYWIYGFVIGPENCFWMGKQDVMWGSECWIDYEDYPPMGPGSGVFGEPYDLAFQLTGDDGQPCEPCIDVENYIWDPKLSEWKDADTENEAVDLPICENGEKKITIHNCGDCPLYNIHVVDKLHDSLEYIKAVPEPSNVAYDPPYYYIEWHFEGPLMPCEIIEIIITFHVVGEECSIDENIVTATAVCEHGNTVTDEDIAYVHCYKPSRSIERPFLRLLENHPNLFPLLQKLLKLLGLF
jgi:hypothetical protein